MSKASNVINAMNEAAGNALRSGTHVRFAKGHPQAGMVGLVLNVRGDKADVDLGRNSVRIDVPVSDLEVV